MIIKGSRLEFEIGQQVGGSNTYRVYTCMHPEHDQECLVQVAISPEKNASLERAAYILELLSEKSDELEQEYARVKTDPNVLLNYGLYFPELVDSFYRTGDIRQCVNILAFRCVPRVKQLVPIDRMIHRDKLRVDLRTSVWMTGKGLKLLQFVHSSGFSIGLVNGANMMIVPKEHYIMAFDWSQAIVYDGADVPESIRTLEISNMAKVMINAIGGDVESRMFPTTGSDDERYDEYRNYLMFLANGNESDAERAKERFYQIADALWMRGFYEFTTSSREG